MSPQNNKVIRPHPGTRVQTPSEVAVSKKPARNGKHDAAHATLSPQDPHFACNCEAREILTLIGDKWSVLIVALLGPGPVRFNELRRSIDGISQRMLTLKLKHLERNGMVTRTVYPTVPPRVEYALTPLGKTLLDPVHTFVDWAIKNSEVIKTAQAKYDKSSL